MIPEELRQYLLSKMAVLESYERQFLPEKRMAERVLAWLDAQPAAPTERWEPVEAGQGDAVLKLVGDGQLLGTWLLDDLRLCRRAKKA